MDINTSQTAVSSQTCCNLLTTSSALVVPLITSIICLLVPTSFWTIERWRILKKEIKHKMKNRNCRCIDNHIHAKPDAMLIVNILRWGTLIEFRIPHHLCGKWKWKICGKNIMIKRSTGWGSIANRKACSVPIQRSISTVHPQIGKKSRKKIVWTSAVFQYSKQILSDSPTHICGWAFETMRRTKTLQSFLYTRLCHPCETLCDHVNFRHKSPTCTLHSRSVWLGIQFKAHATTTLTTLKLVYAP